LQTAQRLQQDQGTHELKAQRRADNLTLLQAQLEHEQKCRNQQEQIASLKDHLAAVVERTTKIRNAYEKEKKQLNSQVRQMSQPEILFSSYLYEVQRP
jgi:hypothetical protein